jgi:CRISPR system Cascade subunit CasD
MTTRHLVFTLAAPMGRFGPFTLHATNVMRKATELEPTKSAILGLVTAAAGLRREHIVAYTEGLAVAVLTVVRPTPWSQPDNQTVTPAPRGFVGANRTRFEELREHLAGRGQSGAHQSWREYWSTGLWLVALAERAPTANRLEAVQEALQRPRFPLFAGVKACGLGLPPHPQIIEKEMLLEAFEEYRRRWQQAEETQNLFATLHALVEKSNTHRILFDLDYPGGPQPERQIRRRDLPDHALRCSASRFMPRWRERVVGEYVLPGSQERA